MKNTIRAALAPVIMTMMFCGAILARDGSYEIFLRVGANHEFANFASLMVGLSVIIASGTVYVLDLVKDIKKS